MYICVIYTCVFVSRVTCRGYTVENNAAICISTLVSTNTYAAR